MTPTELLALASPLSALLGAVLGATGAYVATRRQAATAIAVAEAQIRASGSTALHQIQASTIVASRQRWIDELRAELSKMVAALLRLEIALEQQTSDAHNDWLNEVVQATVLETKIALMLNPYEEPHQKLQEAVIDPLNDLRSGKQIDWGAASLNIMLAGQVVLKGAWDQIRGEVRQQPLEPRTVAITSVSPSEPQKVLHPPRA